MKSIENQHLLVNAVIASDRIFTIPAKKIGKFLVSNKNDENFRQSRDISQDKLTTVLLELVKANSKKHENQTETSTSSTALVTSPSVKRKQFEKSDDKDQSDEDTCEILSL